MQSRRNRMPRMRSRAAVGSRDAGCPGRARRTERTRSPGRAESAGSAGCPWCPWCAESAWKQLARRRLLGFAPKRGGAKPSASITRTICAAFAAFSAISPRLRDWTICMCYPCTHCNRCGREPKPGLCPMCGHENAPGAAACARCEMVFPRPPGPSKSGSAGGGKDARGKID